MPKIETKDAPAWLRRVAKRFAKEGAPRILRDAAAFGVTVIVSKIIPETTPYPPVDTGQYRAGFRPVVEPGGAAITHVNAKMFNIIEHGVRPEKVKIGKKMIDALAGWAHRKLGVRSETEARQVAWAIAQTIKRRGLPPKRVRARAIPPTVKHIVEQVAKWWSDPRNLAP